MGTNRTYFLFLLIFGAAALLALGMGCGDEESDSDIGGAVEDDFGGQAAAEETEFIKSATAGNAIYSGDAADAFESTKINDARQWQNNRFAVTSEMNEALDPDDLQSLPGRPKSQDASAYSSYFYAFQNMILFGYHDATDYTIYNSVGTPVFSGTLNDGEKVLIPISTGTYQLVCSDLLSCLSGGSAPYTGFYAVNDENLAIGRLFYSMQTAWNSNCRQIVFAHHDDTDVEVYDMDTAALLGSTTLDAGEHWDLYRTGYLKTVATKDISVLNFSDMGYTVAADTGYFAGTHFLGFSGTAYTSGNPAALIINSYVDNNQVTVTNSDTSAVVWSGTLMAGEMWSQEFISLYFEIQTTGKAAVSSISYYTTGVCQMDIPGDQTGTRIGTNFYFNTDSGSEINIFSYLDGNQITLTDTNQTVTPADDTIVWSGILAEGGHHRYATTSMTQYHLESLEAVTVFQSVCTNCGAEFIPLYGIIMGCEEDAECDNDEWCDGLETCDIPSGICQPGTPPDCPGDGLFCNGVEFCNEETDACDIREVPCPDDGVYCNGEELCNEDTDSCENSGDPCGDDGQFCNGAEQCNEETDSCDHLDPPCGDDGEFCNGDETCNEELDSCSHSGNPCPPDEICDERLDICVPSDEEPGDDDTSEPVPTDEGEDDPGWPEGEITGGCCGCS